MNNQSRKTALHYRDTEDSQNILLMRSFLYFLNARHSWEKDGPSILLFLQLSYQPMSELMDCHKRGRTGHSNRVKARRKVHWTIYWISFQSFSKTAACLLKTSLNNFVIWLEKESAAWAQLHLLQSENIWTEIPKLPKLLLCLLLQEEWRLCDLFTSSIFVYVAHQGWQICLYLLDKTCVDWMWMHKS